MKDYQDSDKVKKVSSFEGIKIGDAVFNKHYGLGRVKKILGGIDHEVSVYFLESKNIVGLPITRLEYVTGTDEELAVDIKVLSVLALKDLIKAYSNIKNVSIGGKKKKAKFDPDALANAVINAMNKGEKVSMSDLIKEKNNG